MSGVSGLNIRAREGDFVETLEGLIFDVKGLLHPQGRVIAYLRYVPDGRGVRQKNGIKYRKVYDLTARWELIRARWPAYLYRDTVLNREVQAIPAAKLKQHYQPSERLWALKHTSELDRLERAAVEMAEILVKKSGVSPSKIGVSGSILVGLQTTGSDIDLILYGSDTARRCYSELLALCKTSQEGFSSYGRRELHKLYVQRGASKSTPFETFVKHESPKVLQGKFKGTDYFVRCVKDWDELHEAYGDCKYYTAGRATVHARIGSDLDAIFTPNTYELEAAKVSRKFLPLTQVVSFRGRFCEQVHKGEDVIAKGKLEKVVHGHDEAYRLVVGEDPRDYLLAVERRG